jgi:hypothetical protein
MTGYGPAVMNVHQRVVSKTADYAKVQFTIDGDVRFLKKKGKRKKKSDYFCFFFCC